MELFHKSTEAYAKINLLLRIVGIRQDGYHLLSTVMQSVSLSDTVDIRIDFSGLNNGRPSDVCLDPDSFGIPYDSRNTMHMAASAFLKRLEKTGVKVMIKANKRIPVQAGLGGGSSDAAAVLRLLNEGFSNVLSQSELIDVASAVGADVPFFINGGAALCEGVGEKITPVQSFTGLPLVIIKPDPGVSTPEAYAAYDREARQFSVGVREEPELKEILFARADGPVSRLFGIAPYLFNDLTDAAIRSVPEIRKILDYSGKSGCFYSALSGSGSAVFLIFNDMTIRDRVASEAAVLLGNGYTVFSCETIG